MQVRPLSPEALAEHLAERIAALPPGAGGRLRVAVDGAPAAGTAGLADAAADRLRLLGRPVLRLSAGDFLRPASLRYEYGHEDPDSYYDGWLDTNALFREVFDPLEPGGSGRVLPSLWDPRADRATRAAPVPLPPGGVLLLDGPLLLGRWLPLDLSVHLRLSPAALARRTPAEDRWTLPAFARYEQEARPAETADLVVRADDQRRPALVIG
ncbi:uridine kinase [Streptacidiphilus sp. EB129]|uniref:uridine kinase n=1 Tax=Streptacidiphilus sp. EB129 TaxID=3156262 RepID=UPI0035167648